LDTLESRYFIKYNTTLYSLSVQQVIDCSESYGNDGCDEGFIDKTITYAKEKGLMNTTDYDYKGFEWNCNYDQRQVTPVRPTGFVKLGSNADAYKAALAEGPITALVEADRIAFRLYNSGILNSDKCGYAADHAV